MINMKDITTAVYTILSTGMTGYTVERNAERNVDPSVAKSGWIGIYKGKISYEGYIISNQPFNASDIQVIVEVQRASFASGHDVEDDLETAIQSVLELLTANLTLSGTISMTLGYDVEYEINTANEVYIYSGLITIHGEKPTNG